MESFNRGVKTRPGGETAAGGGLAQLQRPSPGGTRPIEGGTGANPAMSTGRSSNVVSRKHLMEPQEKKEVVGGSPHLDNARGTFSKDVYNNLIDKKPVEKN